MYNPWAKGTNSGSLFKFDPKKTGLYTFRWNRPYSHLHGLSQGVQVRVTVALVARGFSRADTMRSLRFLGRRNTGGSGMAS